MKPPSVYERNFEESKTTWIDGGQQHWERTKRDASLPGVEPRVHYVVLQPSTSLATYVTFPDDEATQELRHRAVLVRNAKPLVPQPEGTPMLTRRFSAEERGRMLSVYLRPWVLHRKYAAPHVTHIADLDIFVSDLLQAERLLRKRRMSMKTMCLALAETSRQHCDSTELGTWCLSMQHALSTTF